MGLPVFLGEVPDYQCDKAGRVLIVIGDFSMVMPQHVFEAGCARGKEAIAKWRLGQLGNRVVPINAAPGHG